MNQEEKRKLAKARVKEIKGFYEHLTSYITVNLVLFLINYFTSPNYYWFKWPLLFWGIGIISHWASVFLFKGKLLGAEWEKKKEEDILRKMDL